MTIFNTVMGNEYADLLNMQLELRATLLGITKLALFLVTQFILHLKREKKYELKTAEWMIVILMFGITMIVSIILHDIMLKQKYQSTLFAIVMFSLICLTVFTYVIISAISKNNEKLKEMELMQMQLRQQEENIQAVQERYEEIATIRHDMKNYVASALSLLRDQKYDETEKYLQNFKDLKIGKYKSYVVTDNALINAVLNAKFSYAQEQNIGVKCVITAGLAGMRNYDTSILLSNILDNAIEACEQGKHMYEPKIDVLIRDVASYLHISIKNTISESVLENNKELRTTKKDKKLHGYGTKSCQRIVDAMDGDMEILEEDGWFVVDILLPKSGI
jgi:sensor histidine kinase YesM